VFGDLLLRSTRLEGFGMINRHCLKLEFKNCKAENKKRFRMLRNPFLGTVVLHVSIPLFYRWGHSPS
jgi:hypothetical protein